MYSIPSSQPLNHGLRLLLVLVSLYSVSACRVLLIAYTVHYDARIYWTVTEIMKITFTLLYSGAANLIQPQCDDCARNRGLAPEVNLGVCP